MITFNQYLTELFNKHYDYEKSMKNGDHVAHFHSDNGSKYHVHFTHYNEKSKKNSEALVNFENHDSPERNKQKISNTEGHSAVKVFSTVHHIIKKHMEEHPHIQHVSFGAAHSEPSRVKLYKNLSKHFAHKHTEKIMNQGTSFKIHRDDFK